MSRVPLRSLAAALALALAPTVQARSAPDHRAFSQLVVIGDSVSDTGFFRPTLPTALQQAGAGKFTTNPGSNWTENLAAHGEVGIVQDRYSAGGWAAGSMDTASVFLDVGRAL